ncbi:carboxylate-amine ligase [Thermoleophilia bacterium SCSIO 60948]|nr:carboxylate-amine ligase [Thermoleophilia bacterium SCSIO 60948]
MGPPRVAHRNLLCNRGDRARRRPARGLRSPPRETGGGSAPRRRAIDLIEHSFKAPEFTVGIEEELMILDADGMGLAPAITDLLAAVPAEHEGQVKPELHQAVLEIATRPCQTIGDAGRELADLRRMVIDIAEARGLHIGAAGTHPFARWEDVPLTPGERYAGLVGELRMIARQELIFGTHVHVAISEPDRAIYVADGIRRYLPMLLALSANSPFWRGEATGLMSSRTPIFRAFPRVGIPPHYGTWEIFSHRVELMMRAGAIEDYTYLWWDVRPHPGIGTVETRIFDQQTRLEHTVSLSALVAALAKRLSVAFDAEEPMVEYPTELIDDNKIRAAIRGTDGNLVDFRRGEQVPAPEMVRRLAEQVREHAQDLRCEAELDGVFDLLDHNTGAHRQLAMLERGGELREVVDEVIEHTRP